MKSKTSPGFAASPAPSPSAPQEVDPYLFRFLNGGKFVSAGRGRHPDRVLDSTEFVVVASGTLGIRVGGRSFAAEPGSLLVMPAGVPHCGTAPYKRGLSFYWFHARPDALREKALRRYVAAPRPEALFFWCDALLSEQRVPDNGETCDRVLALVLHEAMRPTSRGGGARAARQTRVAAPLAEAARRALRLGFCDAKFSTASLARALGCNPDYLGRVYRAAFGETILETLENLRMERAERLLLDGASTVSQIAWECGWSDPAWFRRRFTRRHSLPPSAWRAARAGQAHHVNTD